MSNVVDGLGGRSSGRIPSQHSDFETTAKKAASSHVSADAAERRAQNAAKAEPRPLPSGLPAYYYDGWKPTEKPAAKPSSHVSADAAERRAQNAAKPEPRPLPSGLPAYYYEGWTPPEAPAEEPAPCVFVPAEPEERDVESGNTIWCFWREYRAAGGDLSWQDYKAKYLEMNTVAYENGTMNPGETVFLPTLPGAGEWVCTPAPDPDPEPAPEPEPEPAPAPEPIDPNAYIPGMPEYAYPGWTPPVTAPPVAANPACPAEFYSPADDEAADGALWNKQEAFSVRAFPRVLFEGLFGNNNPTGLMGGLNNISKVGGLAPFAYFNTVQKAHEIAGYIETGDYGRATAGVAEMANGLRIGVNGVSSLVGAINSPAGKWISSHLGGTAGQKFGVGANVVAGVGRAYSNYDRYQKELACADTPREEDIASVNHFEAQLGNVLDTGNDLVPMLGRGGKDKPINWATWFASKAMDHWAQDKLEGTAYVPLSIGADHARNLTPLAAAVGLTPTVEHYDLSTARSDDERIVMEESNSVDKAAGISAGVTDVTVTGLEVGLATYYGRKPEIVYGVLQADHIARQGMNIWTGGAWQSPDERAAAVEAAGLDPALDPHRVEYEQEDFLNRSAASAMSDANIARLKAKAYAGGATADELRYLEIVEEYENADIDSSTNGRGSNTGIFSPHGMWESMKLTNPVFSGLDALPEGAGYTIGWVQGGGIGNTVDAVGDFATDVGEGAVDFVSDVGKAGKDFVGHLNPLSWG